LRLFFKELLAIYSRTGWHEDRFHLPAIEGAATVRSEGKVNLRKSFAADAFNEKLARFGLVEA